MSASGYSSLCPFARTNPSLQSSAPGSVVCSPGSPGSASSITIARSVLLTTNSVRPAELSSSDSSFPSAILARSACATESSDTATASPAKLHDSTAPTVSASAESTMRGTMPHRGPEARSAVSTRCANASVT